MSIFVVGINHKTASIALREQFYFAQDKLALYLQDLLNRTDVREAVLLSTCNRSELYCDAKDSHAVRQWFCAQHLFANQELDAALYIYHDEAALMHLMQVACGLDSMVLGESQILGQLKVAFSESCAAGAVGILFHRLFQQVFALAKEIRTTTAIGACPVSVASAAVHFVREKVPDFAKARLLLIGAGDTTQLLLRYLEAHYALPIMLVNRSKENAALLLEKNNGCVYGFDELPLALAHADIIFSATGSATPIVSKAMVEAVLQVRLGKPLFFMDVAVPRDIDPTLQELAAVTLYCIDDLKVIIEKNRQGREHAADKAHELITKKSQELMADLTSLDSVAHTIRAYRGRIEAISQSELTKAKQALHQGEDAETVLSAFAHAFTMKLLHAPSVQLRQAGVEGRFELLQFAKELLAIPDPM